MNDEALPYFRSFADLERQHGIPPEKYCGLSPKDMSRVVVAYHSGPRRPGEPVGYTPVGSIETRVGWLLHPSFLSGGIRP